MRAATTCAASAFVPFTPGREQGRDPQSIVAEARDLFAKGYREVTLLGQNVDGYKWNVDAKGNVKDEGQPVVRFAQLMDLVSDVDPDLRVRFSTSHPKDMTDEVLEVMARKDNLCKYIHLPVQSGHSDVLKRMNRGYTREWYLDLDCRHPPHHAGLCDQHHVIAGFYGETVEQHEATLSLMREVRYEMAFMFKYSERPPYAGRAEVRGRRAWRRRRAVASPRSSSSNRSTARRGPPPNAAASTASWWRDRPRRRTPRSSRAGTPTTR